MTAPRHFLDLNRITTGPRSASILDRALAFKARGPGPAACRQDAGDDLRATLDADPRVLRGRPCASSAGMRIVLSGQETQLKRGETWADTARVLSRYVDAIMIRTDNHDRSLTELAANADGAGHQRPDRPLASLPADGRRDDLRGARRGADRRHRASPGAATATMSRRAGSTPRRASTSSCAVGLSAGAAARRPTRSPGRKRTAHG